MLEFEKILEVTENWHTIEEIAREVKLSADKIQKVCNFLTRFGMVEIQGGKVKLAQLLIDVRNNGE